MLLCPQNWVHVFLRAAGGPLHVSWLHILYVDCQMCSFAGSNAYVPGYGLCKPNGEPQKWYPFPSRMWISTIDRKWNMLPLILGPWRSNHLQMYLQRQHLLSYHKTLSVGLAGAWTRDLPRTKIRCSSNWANWLALKCIVILVNGTKWTPFFEFPPQQPHSSLINANPTQGSFNLEKGNYYSGVCVEVHLFFCRHDDCHDCFCGYHLLSPWDNCHFFKPH